MDDWETVVSLRGTGTRKVRRRVERQRKVLTFGNSEFMPQAHLSGSSSSVQPLCVVGKVAVGQWRCSVFFCRLSSHPCALQDLLSVEGFRSSNVSTYKSSLCCYLCGQPSIFLETFLSFIFLKGSPSGWYFSRLWDEIGVTLILAKLVYSLLFCSCCLSYWVCGFICLPRFLRLRAHKLCQNDLSSTYSSAFQTQLHCGPFLTTSSDSLGWTQCPFVLPRLQIDFFTPFIALH